MLKIINTRTSIYINFSSANAAIMNAIITYIINFFSEIFFKKLAMIAMIIARFRMLAVRRLRSAW